MTYLGSDRFVVRELEGYAKIGTGSHAQNGLCITVLDRAYCCQVMKRWTTEGFSGRLASVEYRRTNVRAEAAELCAKLNQA